MRAPPGRRVRVAAWVSIDYHRDSPPAGTTQRTLNSQHAHILILISARLQIDTVRPRAPRTSVRRALPLLSPLRRYPYVPAPGTRPRDPVPPVPAPVPGPGPSWVPAPGGYGVTRCDSTCIYRMWKETGRSPALARPLHCLRSSQKGLATCFRSHPRRSLIQAAIAPSSSTAATY